MTAPSEGFEGIVWRWDDGRGVGRAGGSAVGRLVARPTHRLDLLLVPDLGVPIGQAEAWLSTLVEQGVIDDDGRPGPHGDRLGVGAFARLHLDRPPGPTLYANRLGGFQVRCPRTDAPVIAPFSRAMARWRVRAGTPRCTAPPAIEGTPSTS